MTDILTGIFSRILNTSVAACFLIGAVFLLRFVFRKVAPKTQQHRAKSPARE